MNRTEQLREKGHFTEIAAFMRESGEGFVRSLGITPPLQALDLGCGDGTTAMPLARWGAASCSARASTGFSAPGLAGSRSVQRWPQAPTAPGLAIGLTVHKESVTKQSVP